MEDPLAQLPLLLTKEEVAHLLAITPSRVQKLQERGYLPYVKLGAPATNGGGGGAVRYDRRDVLAFVSAHRHEARS